FHFVSLLFKFFILFAFYIIPKFQGLFLTNIQNFIYSLKNVLISSCIFSAVISSRCSPFGIADRIERPYVVDTIRSSSKRRMPLSFSERINLPSPCFKRKVAFGNASAAKG